MNINTETREIRKRLVRTVLIFTESSDQLSRATDRVPGFQSLCCCALLPTKLHCSSDKGNISVMFWWYHGPLRRYVPFQRSVP